MDFIRLHATLLGLIWLFIEKGLGTFGLTIKLHLEENWQIVYKKIVIREVWRVNRIKIPNPTISTIFMSYKRE